MSCLFDRIQQEFDLLPGWEKARCGLRGVAADISLHVDMSRKEVLLDRLYKYCGMSLHLFTELLRILLSHFPGYVLIIPTLQGYELAREIERFLGTPTIEALYLKGDRDERLLLGEGVQATFEGILEDTRRHYERRGGIEKKKEALMTGSEISMFFQGRGGEEEVLWMQVRIPLERSLPG